MVYYADYMKDRFYAVADDGSTVVKEWDFDTNSVKSWVGGKRLKHPWLSEENGVGFYVEEMTKEEFDTIGEKWVWDCRVCPSDPEQLTFPIYKHYMKWL